MLRARFRGVRGSIPTPVAENLRHGGNTSCLEVSTSTETLIFDAGSGIRSLGQSLVTESPGQPIEARIFLTHFHWDHIQGIPFFAPIFGPANHIHFFSGSTGSDLKETLEGQMMRPYFPINLAEAAAQRDFTRIPEHGVVSTGSLTIRPFALNHPQGASGYRIEASGAVIVYATDYEHGHAELDRALVDHAKDADLLICDAQYTPAEYQRFRGWGHSTWENAVKVAAASGAKRLVLFHHDPSRSDDALDAIVTEARRQFPATDAAREDLAIEL